MFKKTHRNTVVCFTNQFNKDINNGHVCAMCSVYILYNIYIIQCILLLEIIVMMSLVKRILHMGPLNKIKSVFSSSHFHTVFLHPKTLHVLWGNTPCLWRLAVPIHGALQSPLPALENRDIFCTRAAWSILGCLSRQKHLVGADQPPQLLPGPPESCRQEETKH